MSDWQTLLEDRKSDRRNQLFDGGGHVLEIARHDSAGGAGNRGGVKRQVGVIVVDMNDRCLQRRRLEFLERQPQPLVAMPENGAVATRIDEDDRPAVGRIALHRLAHIDSAAFQRISDLPAVLVRSKRPEIAGAQSQRRACGHHGRRLPTAQESPVADAHLSARGHCAGLDRQLQHFVDGVGADTYVHPALEDWKIGGLEDCCQIYE